MVILSLVVFLVTVGVLYSALIVGKRADEKIQIFKNKKIQDTDVCIRKKEEVLKRKLM